MIPQKCLQVLTTNELSLFLSGIPMIDVDDWEKQTVVSYVLYSGDSMVGSEKGVHGTKMHA